MNWSNCEVSVKKFSHGAFDQRSQRRLHSAPLREDDDINDVAFMAGVNLREENAQILTTKVGSVVQSCQEQLFLSPNPVLRRILRAGTSSYAEAQLEAQVLWLNKCLCFGLFTLVRNQYMNFCFGVA